MQEKIILRKGPRQRLELSETDIMLLAFLEQQRMLTNQQLYHTATVLFGMNILDYSFKNRLRKFEDYKLIRSEFYRNGFDGEHFKFTSIGTKGIDLLIEHNILNDSYNKQKIYKFNNKKNLIHFLATQQAALNILFSLNKKVIVPVKEIYKSYNLLYDSNLFSHSPATIPYEEWIPDYKNLHLQNKGAYHTKIAGYMTTSKSKRSSGKTMTIVKPDWIIRLKPAPKKEIFLNIELDTGSEPIETLIEKAFNYSLLAENNPSEQHYMCIIVIDNTFANCSRFSNGKKRATNLINRFNDDSAVKKRIKESNLIPLIRPLSMIENELIRLLSKYS
jgi:hypothetical protein